jgi:broad specificity phosphatase PhoE
MAPTAYFITHPDVVVDPEVPIPRWPLSESGRARMRAGLERPWMRGLSHVFSSTEQKAVDGAEILRETLDIPHTTLEELGENDRSATGFLPPAEFWEVAEAFFARPGASVRGWERALDAQARVVAAVEKAIRIVSHPAPLALVSHGGVGCLLLCHLRGSAISRLYEQPRPGPAAAPGSGGGYYFAFETTSLAPLHGWRDIDPGRKEGAA